MGDAVSVGFLVGALSGLQICLLASHEISKQVKTKLQLFWASIRLDNASRLPNLQQWDLVEDGLFAYFI